MSLKRFPLSRTLLPGLHLALVFILATASLVASGSVLVEAVEP